MEPVGRGDLTASPLLRQRDRRLAVDQGSIRLGQRLCCAEVVLLDPTEATPGERRVVLPHERRQTDVASLRDERRADARREIGNP